MTASALRRKVAGRTLGIKWGDRLFAVSLMLPAAIVLLALSIYPFLSAVYSSFFKVHTITRVETYVGLGNYIKVLSSDTFWQSMGRTVVWTVFGIVGQLVLGITCALVLHAELKGRTLARGIVLFPYLVPAIVASLVWRFMLNPLTGIVDYVLVDVLKVINEPIAWLGDPKMAMWAVIAVGIWKYVPFMIILFLARLQTTPLELYDAARVDGASLWQEFWHITFPWLKPTILIALLIRTIWLFNHFDMVYLMAFGGPMDATTTVPVLIRNSAFSLMDMGQAAAMSMVMVLVLLLMSIFYTRYYGRAEEALRG